MRGWEIVVLGAVQEIKSTAARGDSIVVDHYVTNLGH